jgi:hypothetical protein
MKFSIAGHKGSTLRCLSFFDYPLGILKLLLARRSTKMLRGLTAQWDSLPLEFTGSPTSIYIQSNMPMYGHLY